MVSRCIKTTVALIFITSPVQAGFDDVWRERIAKPPVEVGFASIYRDYRTASGERFDGKALTCAHRSRPLCTAAQASLGICPARSWVTVRLRGKAVQCRVNDRGPHIKGRVIDLTQGAANVLGLSWREGIAKVDLY